MKRAAALSLAACCGVLWAKDPQAKAVRFFDTRVAPIFSKRCLGCHNDELNDGNISFQNRETLLKAGSRGPAVVPGKPEDSVLIHAVRWDGDLKMPPGTKLPPRDVRVLTNWVEHGAEWGTKLQPKP